MLNVFLRTMTTMQKRIRASNESAQKAGAAAWKYSSIEEFVLENGQSFKCRELPDNIKRGKIKQCFANAYRLTYTHPDLHYVEGYACGIIPVLHAWCVTDDGFVVDNTWEDGTDYLGVVFQPTYLHRIILSRERYSVLDNWENKYPLLTGEHSVGESVLSLTQKV